MKLDLHTLPVIFLWKPEGNKQTQSQLHVWVGLYPQEKNHLAFFISLIPSNWQRSPAGTMNDSFSLILLTGSRAQLSLNFIY